MLNDTVLLVYELNCSLWRQMLTLSQFVVLVVGFTTPSWPWLVLEAYALLLQDSRLV